MARTAKIAWELILPAALLLQQAASIRADSFTWQSPTGGSWSDPANWVNNLPPASDPATQVNLNDSSPGTYVYTLDDSRPNWIVNRVTSNSYYPASPVILNVATDSKLEFAGTSPVLQAPVDTSLTLNGPVTLDSPLSLLGYGSMLTFNGPVSGPGGITLGPGDGVEISTLVLSAANTFTGGVTLLPSSSTLIVDTPNALGTGPVTIDDTFSSMDLQIEAQQGSSTDLAHPLILNGTASLSGVFVNILADAATASHLFVLPSLQANGRNNFAFGVTANATPDVMLQIDSLQLAGTLQLGAYAPAQNTPYYGTITLGSIQGTAPSLLRVSQNMTVHVTGPTAYSGGLAITGGHVYADASHALGTGTITLSAASTLTLSATDAVATDLSAGYIEYNANGAAGGHNISQAYLSFGPAVTGFSDGTATDTFTNLMSLKGNTAQLAMLDRGIGSGTTPNVSFAFEAEIENTDGTLPTIKNLGANYDLILGLGTRSGSSLPVTLGTGTPWQSLDSAAYSGTITANGTFGMYGKYVNGPSSLVTIADAEGVQPVTASLWTANLAASFANYAGVATFSDAGNAVLSADNVLGGGMGTSPIPLDVYAYLTVASPAAMNAPVHFHTNSTLTIQSPGLTGTGAISRDVGPITISLANPMALSGGQLAGFIQPGDNILLSASDIQNLTSLDPRVNLIAVGSSFSQSGTLLLNGGGLKARSIGGTLTPTTASQPLLHIGSDGATFYGAVPLEISVPITADGDIDIQYDPAIGTRGYVSLDNPNNVFHGSINLVSGGLAASSPDALPGATLNLKGGTLSLLNPSHYVAAEYDNPINVLGSVTIPFYADTSPLPTLPLKLGNVALLGGTITFGQIFNQTFPTLMISTLTIGGSGNIVAPQSGLGIIEIGAVVSSGTNQSLTLTQPSRADTTIYKFTGPVSITGPITIGGEAIFDGITTPTASTFMIGSNPGDTLAGTGTIHRTVDIGPSGNLSPGDMWQPPFVSMPGTLSVDTLVLSSTSTLTWDLGQAGVIGGPFNDLVTVEGNLTLAGKIEVNPGDGLTNGRYVLFTYGGTLTNLQPYIDFTRGNAVAVLDTSVPGQVACVVLYAAPEPASLFPLALGATALLTRRRKKTKTPA